MFTIISKPDSLADPYISVVVTAYNRREFIQEAVQSALDQTLDKEKYEIIVIKNYLDNKIDEFLKEKDVLNIYSDERLWGQVIGIGIQEAHGEVISFLDDDDIFLPFKLKEVYNVFRQNDNIAYFRHEIIKTRNIEDVNAQLKEIDRVGAGKKNFQVSDLDSERTVFHIERKLGIWNMSSISIRRKLYLPFQRDLRLNMGIDLYLFFFAPLLNDTAILCFQTKPLSIYRVHDSWIGYKSNITMSEFLMKNSEISRDVVSSYENFINIISSTHADERNGRLLVDNIKTHLYGWHGRVKLAEGRKCNMNEILSLTKEGIYSITPLTLITASLGLFSLLAPNLNGRIYRWGLWKFSHRNP